MDPLNIHLNLSSVADYVYFETSSTSPYQIRRIEELNKVSSSMTKFCGQYNVAYHVCMHGGNLLNEPVWFKLNNGT